MFIDFPEEYTASIFRVEEKAEQKTKPKLIPL
jgi:hypothetical protein